MNNNPEIARRKFVKFLAGSPLLAYTGISNVFAENLLDPDLQYLVSQKRIGIPKLLSQLLLIKVDADQPAFHTESQDSRGKILPEGKDRAPKPSCSTKQQQKASTQ